MTRRFEKSLSLILVGLIMIQLFITTFVNLVGGLRMPILSEIWNICFSLAWIFMFIYSIYILFQSKSKGYSIFIAIITAISFMFLTYHGLAMGGVYISFMPKSLAINNKFLLENSQIIFYTATFVVYVLHLINIFIVSKKNNKDDEKKNLEVKENTSDGVFLVDEDIN